MNNVRVGLVSRSHVVGRDEAGRCTAVDRGGERGDGRVSLVEREGVATDKGSRGLGNSEEWSANIQVIRYV